MNIKMTEAHYNVLLAGFKRFTKAQLADHLQAYEDAGLTLRRACFDVFWTVNKHSEEVRNMMPEFYKYANDDHLFSALKQAVRLNEY